mmetsp:Transcript_5521/g.20777  ORF Transcript_5521/g.20777 Transcript_5521/m.20777 type:complete len:210 (+) Transcript_5521:420-1049(+)
MMRRPPLEPAGRFISTTRKAKDLLVVGTSGRDSQSWPPVMATEGGVRATESALDDPSRSAFGSSHHCSTRNLASACRPGSAISPTGISLPPPSLGSTCLPSCALSQSLWNQRASLSSAMSSVGVGGKLTSQDWASSSYVRREPPGGVLASHTASETVTLFGATSALNPTMSWHGNGHGWDVTYRTVLGSITTPLSSSTSRATACSRLSL